MELSASSFDPTRAFAKELSVYSASSQRLILSTWRSLAKSCAREGVSPWPLTDANVELAARRWIELGVAGKTLDVRRWALQCLYDVATPGSKLTILAAANWAALVWCRVRRTPTGARSPALTVFETGRMIEAMRHEPDQQWLRTLLVWVDRTGASLRTFLDLRQQDISEASVVLRYQTHTYAMPLEEGEWDALKAMRSSERPDAFVFSSDDGSNAISPRRVDRDLARCAVNTLGRPVKMRAVQNAAIRFLIQLGVSVRSLSKVTGLSILSLTRISELKVHMRDMTILRRFGTPIDSEWPPFADLYRVIQRMNDPYGSERDRAILSLIYFGLATPGMISGMERADVSDDHYTFPRNSDLNVTMYDDRVVRALKEWVAVRGPSSGPLFLLNDKSGEVRPMKPCHIGKMVIRRSQFLKRPFSAESLRVSGMARAANAGLPLAQLADMVDMTYPELAEILELHQRSETGMLVARQIDALRQARVSPMEYSNICGGQLLRCYIHARSP